MSGFLFLQSGNRYSSKLCFWVPKTIKQGVVLYSQNGVIAFTPAFQLDKKLAYKEMNKNKPCRSWQGFVL